MDEQRKYAILFAATILDARRLNDSGRTPWAVHVSITDANYKAILSRLRVSASSWCTSAPVNAAYRQYSVLNSP